MSNLTCVIGTGRCGTMSFHQWLGDEYPFERESASLSTFDKPELIRETIGDLTAIVSSHKLAWHIGLVNELNPDCKFVWLRRDRMDTLNSMIRCGPDGFKSADLYGRSCDRPHAVTEHSAWRRIEWYVDTINAMIRQAFQLLPAERTHVCWVEKMRHRACRRQVANFMVRPDLIYKEFPHVNKGRGSDE